MKLKIIGLIIMVLVMTSDADSCTADSTSASCLVRLISLTGNDLAGRSRFDHGLFRCR